MREGIQKYFAQEKGIGILAVFFWFVSLYLLGSSTPLGVGFAVRTGARGFFQKPNWYLYPVFFPVVMWLSYSIWRDYVLAWKDLKEEGVLHSDEFRLVDRDDFGRILRLFARIRPLLFGLACILGIVFTTIDSRSAFRLLSPAAGLELANPCTDRDFFIAARIPDYFPSASWTSSIWFSTWSYLMQGALIALGFLCLFQILFHGLFFTFFEGFNVVKKSRLAILLRVDDPNEEFGLSTWNDAINKGYIFLAAGMGIALVSHFSQPFNGPGLQACSPSSGQRMLGTILWAILVAPTLLPVLARFARLGKIRQIVNATNDESVRAARDKQRLWPWDKWDIGKLFALISLVEWLLIANIIDVRKMIDLVLKHLG